MVSSAFFLNRMASSPYYVGIALIAVAIDIILLLSAKLRFSVKSPNKKQVFADNRKKVPNCCRSGLSSAFIPSA